MATPKVNIKSPVKMRANFGGEQDVICRLDRIEAHVKFLAECFNPNSK